MFATDKIGDTMTVAMTPADGKAWFGAPPPDLTVEARVRGADWLYNYLLGVLPRRRRRATGWNNLVLPERRDAARAVAAVRHEPARRRPSSRATKRRRPRRSPPRASSLLGARQGPHVRRRRRWRPRRRAR